MAFSSIFMQGRCRKIDRAEVARRKASFLLSEKRSWRDKMPTALAVRDQDSLGPDNLKTAAGRTVNQE
jgi:hypothetical protein